MRWDYDPKWRDMFDDGVHRDILIVPHATRVTKVTGREPLVESKIPKFRPGADGARIPNEYEPVEWIITNDDIIQEKFEFADSICSNSKLSFGSCEAAMIKFTIRNNKTFNKETNKWELDIPNLQKIEVVSDDGRTLLGELDGSSIINVYTYVNGNSDSLMWLGMYKVEQDKVSGDGYEREIVAYDFMLTFRDMDIFNWYRSLFDGIPIDSDDWSKGLKKAGKDEWTIKEALLDLFENLCYMSPSQPTITNPKDYLIDMDAEDYPGYGMPIIIDPDLFDKTVPEMVKPTNTGSDVYERFGWMAIWDLPFRKDEKIIKKQSLSCGKFLEDIAMLAGRFGFIRKDKIVDGEYIDPNDQSTWPSGYDPNKPYNMYEKCILSFRPIEAKDEKIVTENCFDDSEVEKGIQYEYYDVKETKIIDVYDYDNNKLIFFCPKGLKKQTKKDYQAGKRPDLNVLTITENMFTSYLKKDNADHKIFIQMLEKGWTGTRNTIVYDGTPLLMPCFNNVIYRPYRPYQLTTTSDLCRMPGDRIKVEGYDKITGEPYEYTSYILVRRCTGIQKMMDKYTAKGDSYAGTYSDYRSGELNDSFHPNSFGYGRNSGGGGGSGNTNGSMENTGITQSDLIEMLRNVGIRLLDEPTGVTAIYNTEDNTVSLCWTDPPDITNDYKPTPAEWAGTVIVRKEGSVPLHRWDGTKIVANHTRGEYSSNPYIDTGVERNKTYFYAFMPYYVALDDDDHPIRYYRWTKTVEVSTGIIKNAPEIVKLTLGSKTEEWDGTEIDFMWSGNNNKMSAKITSGTILFSMYTGSTLIYAFTSPIGSTPADISNIYVGFLKDNTNQIAKPSFVYKTGNTYMYNQEEPTETEMGLIYTWLQAGLPSS